MYDNVEEPSSLLLLLLLMMMMLTIPQMPRSVLRRSAPRSQTCVASPSVATRLT